MPKTDGLISQIKRKLGNRRLFYVGRDAERAAAGLLLGLPNFFIVTNDSPYARVLKKRYGDKIFLIKEKEQLDTQELLARCHPERSARLQPPSDQADSGQGGSLFHKPTKNSSQSFGITIKRGDFVLVFKPTLAIEKICAARGWKLLNPSAALAGKVEEKISQVKWLGSLQKYLPSHRVAVLKKIKFAGAPLILQFNHGHTGSGTILIKSKKQLANLTKKFPNRPARASRFIAGPMFTNNNVVWGGKILLGNVSYQITGLKPFTDREFATVGNDWALPHKILNKKQLAQYQKIATAVGKKLARSGWKGLFGIDVAIEEKTGRLYLIEINARQPASATFESELQFCCHYDPPVGGEEYRSFANAQDDNCVITFSAHLASLLGVKNKNYQLTKIMTGAQIVKRVGGKKHGKLKNVWRVIRYRNTAPGADETRYQFKCGIMSGHNKIKT